MELLIFYVLKVYIVCVRQSLQSVSIDSARKNVCLCVCECIGMVIPLQLLPGIVKTEFACLPPFESTCLYLRLPVSLWKIPYVHCLLQLQRQCCQRHRQCCCCRRCRQLLTQCAVLCSKQIVQMMRELVVLLLLLLLQLLLLREATWCRSMNGCSFLTAPPTSALDFAQQKPAMPNLPLLKRHVRLKSFKRLIDH